jgi:uncharacterized membrane protein
MIAPKPGCVNPYSPASSDLILYSIFGSVFIANLRYNNLTNHREVPNMEKKKITTKKIVLTGLLAALTVVGSGLRITIPVDIGGNTAFHLGNIICALSGILLGPWMGGLAAGLGSAIYDMLNPMYIAECWLTFLMKGAYGLMAGLVAWSGKKEWGYLKSALASAAGAVTYAILYLAKSFLKAAFVQGTGIAGGWIALIGKIPATVFNAAVAVIFAPILAAAIRAALKKNHLTLE